MPADDAERIYRKVVQEAPLHGQTWFNRLIEAVYSLDSFPHRCEAVERLSRPEAIVRKLL